MKEIKIFYLVTLLLIAFLSGCKKFVQVDPPATTISAAAAYSTNTSAAAVMTGIYINMMNSNSSNLASGQGSLSYRLGLAADELVLYSTSSTLVQFYTNSYAAYNGTTASSNYYFWTEIYKQIHVCDAILEGLQNSTGVTDGQKKQLSGEAKFMRALLFFYGVNLYGDIPIAISTNYEVNSVIKRSSVADVYQQIITDLKDAQLLLGNGYVDGTGTIATVRVRPNAAAATALLARVYLYMGTGHYGDAETQATTIISNPSYILHKNLDSVFLSASQEAIWQMQPVAGSTGYTTYDGADFILTGAPGSGSKVTALNTSYLTNAFETGDIRYTKWINKVVSGSNTYYYPYKYKVDLRSGMTVVPTEYITVLRLAEQYLIRAEARAQQNKLTGAGSAIEDLNVIRNRAGLSNYAGATDQASVLAAIMHERQVELFTEWGHRWFDLKRTGNLDNLMGSGGVCASKGGNWASYKVLLPIPFAEIQYDRNLTQNPGY